MTTRILLVDDQPLFRQGVASLLGAQPDLAVVGAVGSVQEAVHAARDLQPDLVLMDYSLPDGTGLDATRAILADRPVTPIVFLTVFDDDEGLFAAIRQGARGYVLKDVSVTELLAFVRASARGEPALAPALNTRVLGELARSAPCNGTGSREDGQAALTDRELEVLRELSTGASNQEIARKLVISLSTVKNHLHNILTKLHLRNRREAMQYALAHPRTPMRVN
jgi:DNA-binding NarL/FixJ family response regulator